MSSTSVVFEEEEWVKSAMSNDSIVANLLIGINLHNTRSNPRQLLPNWTVRQRRSNNNNKQTHTGGSPTTPFSFCAATSLSEEDSTQQRRTKLSDTTRSKQVVNGDREKTASKRSRKKKTLPELKEEEKLLVKERRELKRELTALRVNLDKQKSTNERLKRIKLDLQPNSVEPSSLLSNDVKVQPSTTSDHKIALPDLNMPFDDPSADVICRVG